MSAGGARRGRRDNGLHVAEYAVAGDVDPRVGEHLLDVLAAGGIAAYLQPSADLDPVTRTTNLPSRPTDRLFVDRAHLDLAREYLAKLSAEAGGESITPEEPVRKKEPDVDAEWARIVAGFDTAVDPASTPWPESENVTDKPQEHNRRKTDKVNGHDPMAPPPEKRRGLASATEFSGVTVPREEPSLLDGLDTFGADLPVDDDERYVPPPPPPMPRISTPALLGVLGIFAGFVLFVFPGVLPIQRNYAMLIGFGAIIAGFVTLVWRLRTGDDDDAPGDGAVV
ncbi:DUF308 domain-containing protein [Catenuloplanes indicus]|uniref:DUF308 domain-containing protein n=1 Tax=Catenuloplanes indicus TaxID=137267 RepID=A0AAE3VZ92_9ACTN|nr:DUF308 domain-containing protein [Catenuloplanes indicus]MDQ0365924.1 hypothetical protein [Catenuloplanes indicus]